LDELNKAIALIGKQSLLADKKSQDVHITNAPSPELESTLKTISDTFTNSILPLVKVMDGKLDLDLATHKNMAAILNEIEALNTSNARVKDALKKKAQRQIESRKQEPKK
jgi:hypothetical protein